ncbi:MAG: outer membrane beta-barrel protein [Bacteroidetes bacterium]|nr:outer membrane beta-barrel protein [Bacteroidota bacterium]
MKKTILLGVTIFFASISFAWNAGDGGKTNTLEIHGKGSANSNFLFNNNISNAGNIQDYAAGWGFNYGVGVSMYFGNIGFGVEGLVGNHRGAYAGSLDLVDSVGTVTGTKEYSSNVNLKVTQIPVFFKMKSEVGGYFEIGPQYNIISEAKYHFTTDGFQSDSIMTTSYAKSYISAVLGLGFKVPVGKTNFSILAGLRLQYSLTDLKGVDALGREFVNSFVYKDAQSTSAASGGLLLGVVYTIGDKKKNK